MKKTTIVCIIISSLVLGSLAGYGVYRLIRRDSDQTLLGEDKANPTGSDQDNDIAAVTPPPPPPHETFNVNNAMTRISYLSSTIGRRVEGTPADRRAADYIHGEFSALGYDPVLEQSYPLKNGLASYNVYIEDKGTRPEWTIIIGAHYDTSGLKITPGANDNASGVGAVLELARVFKSNAQVPTLRFVAFGAEEITEGYTKNDHHYGSRYMASQLGLEGNNVIGMISMDMIGVGSSLAIYATLKAPKTFLDLFYAYASQHGVTPIFQQDQEWSDHESFEAHGISSFWIEFTYDPYYHTPNDTYDRINVALVNQAGQLVQGFLKSLDSSTCEYLDTISNYR